MRRSKLIAALVVACMLTLVPGRFLAQEPSDGPRKVLNKVPPVYPAVARNMDIRGIVKVEALVAPNGTVKSVEVKGGHPVLAQAAVDAVRQWKWQPAAHETKESVELKFHFD